jgi:hypothetical protein
LEDEKYEVCEWRGEGLTMTSEIQALLSFLPQARMIAAHLSLSSASKIRQQTSIPIRKERSLMGESNQSSARTRAFSPLFLSLITCQISGIWTFHMITYGTLLAQPFSRCH